MWHCTVQCHCLLAQGLCIHKYIAHTNIIRNIKETLKLLNQYRSIGTLLHCIILTFTRILWNWCVLQEARGCADGWGIALQAGRSGFDSRWCYRNFFIQLTFPFTLWSWVWLSFYQKWVTKYVKWSRYRPSVFQRMCWIIAQLILYRSIRSRVSGQQQAPAEAVPNLQEAEWAPGPVTTGSNYRPHRNSFPDFPEIYPVVKAAGAKGWQTYYLQVPIVLKSGSLKLLQT